MVDQGTNTGETGTGDLAAASNLGLTPKPPASTPSAPLSQTRPPASTAPSSIADEVGLPTRYIASPRPPPTGVFNNDVARILEAVKLPTRTEFHASADTPPPVYVPIPETPSEIAPKPPPEPKPRDVVSAVHTLKDDFQDVVQGQNISLIQAAALEQEKRARKRPDEEAVLIQDAKRRHAFGVVSAIGALIVLGTIALSAAFLIIRERAGVTPPTFLVEGLLFSEQTVPLPVQNKSAAELKRQLAEVRGASGLTLGAITRIAPVVEESGPNNELVTREITTVEFLRAIDSTIPEELLRALGDEFFFGFHTVDENAPVLIIPITSYERAFAGMLSWEKTVNADLSPAFTSIPQLVRRTDGLLTERTFSDTVMRNYDVRILKDDAGTVQLYYSFPTRDILIIAESPYSFAEILSRLRADRRL